MIREVHTVQFFSPGTFVSEESSREIGEWSPQLAVRMAQTISERYGARPYGFRFTTQLRSDPVKSGEHELAVVPKTLRTSGMHFINGAVESFRDIEQRADPKESILRTNMRCNGHAHICVTRNSFKSVQPFGEDDCVVDDRGEVVLRGSNPELARYRADFAAEREAYYADAMLAAEESDGE